MKLWRGLFFLFLLSLSLGQFGRILLPPKEIGFYWSDLFLSFSVLACLFYLLKNKRTLPRLSLGRPILGFGLWGLFSLVLSLRLFAGREVIVGSLYWWRWSIYALVYWLSFETTRAGNKDLVPRALVLTGTIIAVWGFFQLWCWPDFSFMAPFGWDPHDGRLLSVFFDPNLSGGFLVIVLSLLVSFYLFNPRPGFLVLSLVVYFALVLTYSRSAYFAFLLSMLVIGVLKEKKVFLVALVAFLVSFQVNPRVKTRIEGAAVVDESATHRLTSWDAAWTVIRKHPLVGVGFNNYRQAQVGYGLVDSVNRGGHAGAGADSSFLFVWATTGLIGLSISVWLGAKAVRLTFSRAKTHPLALACLTSLVGLVFHGQFVNSWFFPPIMTYLWAMIGALEANG